MENPIEDYVVQARQSGFNDNQIKETLLSIGWDESTIDGTLANLPGAVVYDEEKARKQLKIWLRSIFLSQRWRLMVLGMLTIGAVLLSLLEPWPNKLLVDSVFGDVPAPGFLKPYTGTIQLLYIVAFFIMILFVINAITSFITSRISIGYSFDVEKKIKSDFFSHVLRLPLNYRAKLQSGDYIYRQNAEAPELASFILDAPVAIFGALINIIGVLVVMAMLNLQLTLVALVAVPALYVSTKYFGPKLQQRSEEAEEVNSKVYALSTESIENTRLIQSFSREKYQNGKLMELMDQSFIKSLKIMYLGQAFTFVNGFVIMIGVFIVVFIGGQQIFDGNMFFGELLVFLSYMNSLYGPIEALSESTAQIRESYAIIERVFEVIEDHTEVDSKDATGYVLSGFNTAISFRNANIISDETYILKNVNLDIPKGGKIGLIGPSGSGKSTLLNVLPLFTDYSGSIKIDGIELHDVNNYSLRSQMSIVSQDPELFSDTVYNNIRFAIEGEATYEQVSGAAHAANAHEFIMLLPQQYQTDIGEAGGFLSGGQLQRIAIARAFLRDAPILLMDEPTSALDTGSESVVIDTINRLIQHRTVIMITHKFSLLERMSDVYVVEDQSVKHISQYGGVRNYETYLTQQELR